MPGVPLLRKRKEMMTDILRDRIGEVLKKHMLVRYDRRAWWCQCGDDCLSVEGSHANHVSGVLVTELGLDPWEVFENGPAWEHGRDATGHVDG